MTEKFFLVRVQLPEWADVESRLEDIRGELETHAGAAVEFYTHAQPVVRVQQVFNSVWCDRVFTTEP